jgi:hypothetical protein
MEVGRYYLMQKGMIFLNSFPFEKVIKVLKE